MLSNWEKRFAKFRFNGVRYSIMLQKLQQLIPFEERTVQRREVLLPAGAVADSVFYIQSGI